jgi:hypothetical protein
MDPQQQLLRIAQLEADNLQYNALGMDLQNQLAAAQQQLAQNQLALNANANAPRHPPRIERPKIPIPHSFTGDTGAHIDEWIDEVVKQFIYYPDHFVDDELRINYALAYVNIKVTTWYKQAVADHHAAGNDITT